MDRNPQVTAASRAVWDVTAEAMRKFEKLLAVEPGTKRIRHTSPPGPRQVRVTIEVLPPLS